MKRIAVLICSIFLVASQARADGIKGVAGGFGVAGVSGLLCVLSSVYLDADDPSSEGYDRRGFFVGAGGSYAGENFDDNPVHDVESIFDPLTSTTSDDSWSVRSHAGYRCHSRFSVSASAEVFGGFDTTWSGFQGTGSDDIDLYAVTADVKGYLLTGRYQPYVLLGGGFMKAETKPLNPDGVIGSQTPAAYPDGVTSPPRPPIMPTPIFGPVYQSGHNEDFVLRLGGGVDLYATQNVVVNLTASYLVPLGELSRIRVYSVGGGFEYRF